jgi:hypothetical protein
MPLLLLFCCLSLSLSLIFLFFCGSLFRAHFAQASFGCPAANFRSCLGCADHTNQIRVWSIQDECCTEKVRSARVYSRVGILANQILGHLSIAVISDPRLFSRKRVVWRSWQYPLLPRCLRWTAALLSSAEAHSFERRMNITPYQLSNLSNKL